MAARVILVLCATLVTSRVDAQTMLSDRACELNQALYSRHCEEALDASEGVNIPCRLPAPSDCFYKRFRQWNVTVPTVRGYWAEYPKAPEDFSVTVSRTKRVNTACNFGLNITWTAPWDESGRYLAGFLLIYSYLRRSENGTVERRALLRTFSFNSNLIHSSSIPTFIYDCGVVLAEFANETRVELHSLPRSSTNYKIAYLYQQHPASVYDNKNASDWRASVVAIASEQDSTIDVWFYQAQKEFRFTNYSVSIKISLSSGTEYEKCIQRLASQEEARLHVRFENVRPNVYEVQVRPIHPHGDATTIGNVDMRKSKPSQHVPSSSNHLTSGSTSNPNSGDVGTSTSPFYDTTPGSIDQITWTDDPNPFAVMRSADSDGERAWTEVNIRSVVITVAVLSVAAVVVLLVAFAIRRRKRKERCHTISPGSRTVGQAHLYEEKEINVIVPATTWPISTPVAHVIPVPVSSVLIIYSSDVPVHRAVITRFATFLQRRCSCDVRYDAWAQKEIMRESPLVWLLRQIRSVQNIVVINSEGGRIRFNASLDGKEYEKLIHDTPMADLFLPAMMEFRHEIFHRKVHRFFHVYFPYASVSDVVDLYLGQPYEMMRHLEDLFLLIHGLSKYSREGVNSAEMINAKRYVEFEEGKALAAAIGDACEYFKANPNWFDDVYRVATDSRATDHNDASVSDNGKATGVRETSIDSGIVVQGSRSNSNDSKPSKTGQELEVTRPALKYPEITAEDLPSGLFIAPRSVRSLPKSRGTGSEEDDDVDREINPMLGREWIPPRMDDGSSLDAVSMQARMREYRYESDDYSEGFDES